MSGAPAVLFVCVHNAGRSQMAAALLDHHAQGRVHVRSAGSAPASEINPAVRAAMAELGLDLSTEFPKRPWRGPRRRPRHPRSDRRPRPSFARRTRCRTPPSDVARACPGSLPRGTRDPAGVHPPERTSRMNSERAWRGFIGGGDLDA